MELFSIGDVQKRLSIGRTKIYEMFKTGVLPASKIGRRTLVRKSDLEAFLAGLASYPTRETEEK